MTGDERLKSNLRMQSFDDNESFRRERTEDMTVEQAMRELDYLSLNGPMTARQREAARVVVSEVKVLDAENEDLRRRLARITEYQSHLLKSAVEHSRYEPRVAEVFAGIADELAKQLRNKP